MTYSTILKRNSADELFGLFVYGGDDEAPKVDKVTPGSAASLANPKLKVGSNILAVNGKRMIGAAAIAAAIRAAPYPAPLVLEVEDPTSSLFTKQYKLVTKEANKRAARLAKQGLDVLERAFGVDLDGDGDVGGARELVTPRIHASENHAPPSRVSPVSSAKQPQQPQPPQPPKPPPTLGVVDNAPSSPTKLTAAASSFSVRVSKPPHAPPTLGLVLAGNAEEPPLIVDIPAECLVERAWPRLHPGMRILAINRTPVHGPAKAAMLSTESLATTGSVLIDVDDSHARTAPRPLACKGHSASGRGPSSAVVAPAPPNPEDVRSVGSDPTWSPSRPMVRSLGSDPTWSPSRPMVRSLEDGINSLARATGLDTVDLDGDGKHSSGPLRPRERWGSLGLTVAGKTAFEAVASANKYQPGALASELGAGLSIPVSSVSAVKLKSSDAKLMEATVAQALEACSQSERERGGAGPAAAAGLWGLDAWVESLEPHRVLAQGMRALLQRAVSQLGGSYSAALEYHFVAALGSASAARSHKLFTTLLSHREVADVLASLLLDGARQVAHSPAQTAPHAAVTQPLEATTISSISSSFSQEPPSTHETSAGRLAAHASTTASPDAPSITPIDFEHLPADVTAASVSPADVFRLAAQADEFLRSADVDASSTLDVTGSKEADDGAVVSNGGAVVSNDEQPTNETMANAEAKVQAAARNEIIDEETQALAEEKAALASAEEAAAQRAAEAQAKLAAERATLEEKLGTAEEEVAAEVRKRAEAIEAEAAAMRLALEEERASLQKEAAIEAAKAKEARLAARSMARRAREEAEAAVEEAAKEAEEATRRAVAKKAKEAKRLADELYESQHKLMQANLALNAGGTPVLLDRFVENNPAGFDLKYGTLADFRNGLTGLLGEAPPAEGESIKKMEKEHTDRPDSDEIFEVYNYGTRTTSRHEFYFVTDPSKGRLKQLGLAEWPQDVKLKAAGRPCRQALPLRAFRSKRCLVDQGLRLSGESELSVQEFIAARLYTGPLYMKYNGTLRGIQSDAPQFFRATFQRLCLGNNYGATIHMINRALVKLSLLQRVQKVYRGLAGNLPESMRTEDKYGARGGVELGFMSTTADRSVALEYASSSPGSLVLELEQGLLDRGAEISWLSQYPGEAEVCFPPLTCLDVHSSKVQASILVVGTRPSLCTRPGSPPRLDDLDADSGQQLEVAIRRIGDTIADAVDSLIGSKAVVLHTPVRHTALDSAELEAAVKALPPVKENWRRVDLVVDQPNEMVRFDAFVDVDLSQFSDEERGSREAIVTSLSEVLTAATEVLDAMAHGELLGHACAQSPPQAWVDVFVETLVAHVDRNIEKSIDLPSIAEMKKYNTPPPAVSQIMTATLTMLEGLPFTDEQGKAGSLQVDKDKLKEWNGVRSLLNDALIPAIFHFDPAQCNAKRWQKVNALLDGITVRDAMRCSAPLAAVFRWIKANSSLSNLISAPGLVN